MSLHSQVDTRDEGRHRAVPLVARRPARAGSRPGSREADPGGQGGQVP